MEEPHSKEERRELRRKNRRKMRISGGSVRLLLELTRRRAAKAKNGSKEGSNAK